MQLPELETSQLLAERLSTFGLEEEQLPAGAMAAISSPAIIARIRAGILGKFADFMGDHLDVLPPKDAVLSALDRAIDLAFTAIGRPVIASIIKPVVKRSILEAASRLYDSIVDGLTAEPRTEV